MEDRSLARGQRLDAPAALDFCEADKPVVDPIQAENVAVKADGLIDSQAFIETQLVGDETDLTAGLAAHRLRVDDCPFLRTENAGDEAKQSTFADSVDPGQQADLSGRDVKVETRVHGAFAVAELQVPNGKHLILLLAVPRFARGPVEYRIDPFLDVLPGESKLDGLVDEILGERLKESASVVSPAGDFKSNEMAKPRPRSKKSFGFKLTVNLDDGVGIDLQPLGQIADGSDGLPVFQSAGQNGQFDGPFDLFIDGESGLKVDLYAEVPWGFHATVILK